jgi:hypothetical protein
LLDVDGNIQVIRAHGVDEIAVVARTRLPPVAREIFPVIRAYMPWMETGAGHVELLIGLDNRQWLPAHVEDSWDPDDDMRLMRSVFGYRYMITDRRGRDLFPPDNTRDGQADAQGGGAEPADAAQEVRLEEYRGWSQGTWSHENSGVPDAASLRDRGRGGAPQRPWEGRCPRDSCHPKRRKPGRRLKGTRWGVPGSVGTHGPARDAILSGQRGSAAEAQTGDPTSEEKDARQSPTCAKPWRVEPGWLEPGQTRPGWSNQNAAATQAAPSRPRKVAGTTAADGARGPGAEVGSHDGGDDAWHAASKWLSC